jgi:lipoate-protein ligase A
VAWLCQPSRAALVLGSAQPSAAVDQARARAAGVEVVRRRSGGGAVLVVPEQVVWLDLAVPAGDPLWCADVGRAFWWVGRLWADALDEVGLGPAAVHSGRPVATSWSATLCFAGLGAGEVTVGGRKVVGISQRRARPGAVFHSAAFLRLDARELVALLDLPEAARREAAAAHETAAAPLGVPGRAVPDRATLEAVLLRRLP